MKINGPDATTFATPGTCPENFPDAAGTGDNRRIRRVCGDCILHFLAAFRRQQFRDCPFIGFGREYLHYLFICGTAALIKEKLSANLQNP